MIFLDTRHVASPALASLARQGVVALALALVLLACGTSNGSFTPCVASPDCGGGRSCFELGTGAGICLHTCASGSALCDQGEACAPTAELSSEWVCLPGGEVAINGVCSRSVDCDLGGLCVNEGSFSVCRRACDPRLPNCLAGTTCSAWTEERGYCAPFTPPQDQGTASMDAG